MVDSISFYPKADISFVFTKNMGEDSVGWFNDETFRKSSAILTKNCCNPETFLMEHVPIRKSFLKTAEVNRHSRTLTDDNPHEIVEIVGGVIELFDGLTYKAKIRVYLFKIMLEIYSI